MINKRLINTGAAGLVATDNFDTVLYTGTNSTQSIDTGFKPDLIWFKNRSGAYLHQIYDSIRGVDKCLNTGVGGVGSRTGTEAEFDDGGNDLMSFDDNGFTIGASALGSVNENGFQHVAWCWKAGGAAVSNTDGTITSTVSANQDAGFSIVKWTGNGSTNIETIGHGLSQAPEMIIWKNIDRSQNWHVYNSYGSGTSDWGYLNLTDGFASTNNPATMMNQTAPTSTVFTIYNNAGNANTANYNGEDSIAYCFHSVDGYQKVGSYTGTGNDIPVTTGFQPRFIMVKRTDSTGTWGMFDIVRGFGSPYPRLVANGSDAENTGTQYLASTSSTGFTIKGTSIYGTGTFIYLAIA